MTSPTILVTGATGNVGGALVRLLQSAGAAVLAGSRSGEPVAGAPGRRVDFSDPAGLKAAMQGVDQLFLLLPLAPGKEEMAAHALQAAREAGVRHVLRSSGGGADSSSPYALMRLQGRIDDAVRASGLPWTVVCPAGFMQNWVVYHGAMVRSGTVYLPHGQAGGAYIDARDIAAAVAAILRDPQVHAGKTYTLTGPESLTVPQILSAIDAATGRSTQYVPVPQQAAVAALQGMGMDPWLLELMASLNQATEDGALAATSPDLQTLTGHPGRRFADFALEHADAWRLAG
jgi:uncharacterized protein YbjT (DUF2867 family)